MGGPSRPPRRASSGATAEVLACSASRVAAPRGAHKPRRGARPRRKEKRRMASRGEARLFPTQRELRRMGAGRASRAGAWWRPCGRVSGRREQFR
ncbi:hypothetical protein NDU88_003218 [Pleurodeles waltl]|uniref:Uncharacterized protein n=1 Tax=Pleurodeles waltl TaxID=8319 RepID=A0AAV7SG72_PLEWA|nr:hypothetical protein NDU88_003218 [Pleurodeles waltl]